MYVSSLEILIFGLESRVYLFVLTNDGHKYPTSFMELVQRPIPFPAPIQPPSMCLFVGNKRVYIFVTQWWSHMLENIHFIVRSKRY